MYIKNRKKAVIDDGMNPEFVAGAGFDGIFEMPIIKKPKEIIIPKGITPFSHRNRVTPQDEALCFNEMDTNFSDVLIEPDKYIGDFNRFCAIISPDCSLYRNAPLSVQITNIYRNRAIGHYYQQKGLYVIPQVRWGNDWTYTTKVLPEPVAFLGVEKHSIVAIGTYGCICGRDNKYHFKAGLEAMLEKLMPDIVLVYGPIPDKVFGDYKNTTKFVVYPDWVTRMHGGDR